MGVEDYRTPDELAEYEAENEFIQLTIDHAKANWAFTTHAITTAQPAAIVDEWIDLTYDHLESLPPRTLARLVLTLLATDAAALSLRLGAEVGDDVVEEATQLWTRQGYGTRTGN